MSWQAVTMICTGMLCLTVLLLSSMATSRRQMDVTVARHRAEERKMTPGQAGPDRGRGG